MTYELYIPGPGAPDHSLVSVDFVGCTRGRGLPHRIWSEHGEFAGLRKSDPRAARFGARDRGQCAHCPALIHSPIATSEPSNGGPGARKGRACRA
jgi:hypothetical protein